MASRHRPRAPTERQVAAMFDEVVRHYDLLNRILSLGLDRRWRRRAVVAARVRPGDRVLDLGCGTGELGLLLAERAWVTGVDTSSAMLRMAALKAPGGLRLVRGSAFDLPFRAGVFDAVVSGFVLRNLHDLSRAFGEVARVSAPGARLALVDITRPTNALLRVGFDAYFRTVAPALGAMVGKRDAYRYLVRSLSQLPPAAQVRDLLSTTGFERCESTPLAAGAVTLFTGVRSAGLPTGRAPGVSRR